MKTIGIIGGMSWESTLLYYRLINEETRKRLGGLHSAPILLHSVDFAEIRVLQEQGRWDEAGCVLGGIGKNLAKAGADFLIIATNTMHIVADAVEAQAGLPLLHIADPTAEAIQAAGIGVVGLLGTDYTMRKDFYKGRLRNKFGLDVLLPCETDMGIVNRIIFNELCCGKINEASRLEYQRIIADLASRGARAIVLGCTEITLLIQTEHSPVPLFDTTDLHAKAAVEWSIV